MAGWDIGTVDEWVSSREPPVDLPSPTDMAHLFPSLYESHLRILHTIRRKATGERVSWKELCHELGVRFDLSVTDRSLSGAAGWGKWPEDFDGPTEGELDGTSAAAFVALIGQTVPGEIGDIVFRWYPFPSERRQLGSIGDLVHLVAEHDRFGPVYIYPSDESWLLCTPYDERTSWIACSKDLATRILNCSGLEAMPVPPTASG